MISQRHSGCSGRGHTLSVMSWSTPTAAGATTQGSGDGSSDIPTECFPWSPTDHEPQLEHWRGAWLWHAVKLVLTALSSRLLSLRICFVRRGSPGDARWRIGREFQSGTGCPHQRRSGRGQPLSGTKEPWLAPLDSSPLARSLRLHWPLATLFSPLATHSPLAIILSPLATCRRPRIGFVFQLDSALVRPK